MPELPEVEVVRRGLVPHTVGRTITDVSVVDPRSLKREARSPEGFADALRGNLISAVARRGKFLWFELEAGALVTHLGMSGQMRVRHADKVGAAQARTEHQGPAPDPLRHRRITLTLDDGTQIDFIDQRLFGGMHLDRFVDTADGHAGGCGSDTPQIPACVTHIARDVLDPHMRRADVVAAMRRRRTPIKGVLLNQEVLSGIGNIYADETLWQARVHPLTSAQDVSAVKAGQLVDGAKEVMLRALDAGGTSFDALYVNVDGRSGYFAQSLAAYGRGGKPCRRCGKPLHITKWQGRSCYHCKQCQRTA
ncbi:bifunctional DNA-formamidopyrimidine glycosylase/DNA-(apurinic or apyrimidinic site) lyase [Dermabacteraceae bacterium P13138]